MSLQQILWGSCAATAGLAAYASWADRRALNRTDPDSVSLVPWPFVMIMSILASAILCSLALKSS